MYYSINEIRQRLKIHRVMIHYLMKIIFPLNMSGLNVEISIDKKTGRTMMQTMKVPYMILCMMSLACTAIGEQAGDFGNKPLETGQAEQNVQLAKDRFKNGLASFMEVLDEEKNLILCKRNQAANLQARIAVQRELVECLKKISEQVRRTDGDGDGMLLAEISYLDARRCLSYMENSVELENVLNARIQLKQARYDNGLAGADEILAAREALILHRRALAMNAQEIISLQRDLVALLKQKYELLKQKHDSGNMEGGDRLLQEFEQRHREAAEELK